MTSENPKMVAVRFLVPFPTDIPTPQLNIDELKVAATAFADKYDGLVVTADNYAEGKAACAEQKAVIDRLTQLKTALRKQAAALVAPAINGIDEVLSIVKAPYDALHDGVTEIKASFDNAKITDLRKEADALARARFPTIPSAAKHLYAFIDSKCAEKRGGWLTKSWTVPKCREGLSAECDRMEKAMAFINSQTAGRPAEYVRVAKYALVENGFNEVAALSALADYEQANATPPPPPPFKPDPAPSMPAPVPQQATPPTPTDSADDRFVHAVIEFNAPKSVMIQLVAAVKSINGISYKVLEQKFV